MQELEKAALAVELEISSQKNSLKSKFEDEKQILLNQERNWNQSIENKIERY